MIDDTVESRPAPVVPYRKSDASAEPRESEAPARSKFTSLFRSLNPFSGEKKEKVSYTRVCIERVIYVEKIKRLRSAIIETPWYTGKSFVRFHHVKNQEEFLKKNGYSYFPAILFDISIDKDDLKVTRPTKVKFSFFVDEEKINIKIVQCAKEQFRQVSLVSEGSGHVYARAAKNVTVRKDKRQPDTTKYVYYQEIYHGENSLYQNKNVKNYSEW